MMPSFSIYKFSRYANFKDGWLVLQALQMFFIKCIAHKTIDLLIHMARVG